MLRVVLAVWTSTAALASGVEENLQNDLGGFVSGVQYADDKPANAESFYSFYELPEHMKRMRPLLAKVAAVAFIVLAIVLLWRTMAKQAKTEKETEKEKELMVGHFWECRRPF